MTAERRPAYVGVGVIVICAIVLFGGEFFFQRPSRLTDWFLGACIMVFVLLAFVLPYMGSDDEMVISDRGIRVSQWERCVGWEQIRRCWFVYEWQGEGRRRSLHKLFVVSLKNGQRLETDMRSYRYQTRRMVAAIERFGGIGIFDGEQSHRSRFSGNVSLLVTIAVVLLGLLFFSLLKYGRL